MSRRCASLMQNKTSSGAHPSSSPFPSYSALLLLYPLTPQTLPDRSVFSPSCSTLHTQLVLISGRRRWVGTRMEPLAGKRHVRCTVVTNREKPHQTFSSGAAACQFSCVDAQTLCMFCRAKSSSLAPNSPGVSLE